MYLESRSVEQFYCSLLAIVIGTQARAPFVKYINIPQFLVILYYSLQSELEVVGYYARSEWFA